MKLERYIETTEIVEIPESAFPIYLARYHWSGPQTYYHLTPTTITMLKVHDVYAGSSFTYTTRDLWGGVNGVTELLEDLGVDELEAALAGEGDGDKLAVITEQEWLDALSFWVEVIRG